MTSSELALSPYGSPSTATAVSTVAVTPAVVTAFTLTGQPLTPAPAGPQATATTVQTAAPVIYTTVGSMSVAAASTSRPTAIQCPIRERTSR